jgi:hypothetical protein
MFLINCIKSCFSCKKENGQSTDFVETKELTDPWIQSPEFDNGVKWIVMDIEDGRSSL